MPTDTPRRPEHTSSPWSWAVLRVAVAAAGLSLVGCMIAMPFVVASGTPVEHAEARRTLGPWVVGFFAAAIAVGTGSGPCGRRAGRVAAGPSR